MTTQIITASLGTFAVDAIPDEIQWMPPGRHEVTGTIGGEPATVVVKVDAATAAILRRQLQDRRATAAAVQGDIPYIDLNHDDQEASGRILDMYWAGEDPVKGGIRAKVEWTGVGKRALLDQSYRRFSPSFYMPDAQGRISGAPINMGGLVNRAAFRTISPLPLAAKDAANGDTIDNAAVGFSSHPYHQAIKKLVDNLGMAQSEAQAQVNKRFPDLHQQWLADEFAQREAAISQTLKSKGSLAPEETAALVAETERMGAAAKFVNVFRGKLATGLTRSQAIDAAMAESPRGHHAWVACKCQPGL